MSVPANLHYVWVGGRPKPDALVRRIERWRSAMPEARIVEWNEARVDLDANRYVAEAYAARRFAFVSDYVRLLALEREGGIYLDTDVELLRSPSLLMEGPTTFGFEVGAAVATSTIIAAPGCPFIGRLRRDYEDRAFLRADGSEDQTTNVERTTTLLRTAGLRAEDRAQKVEIDGTSVRVLPSRILSPYDYLSGIDRRDDTSVAVHLFEGSWLSPTQRVRTVLSRFWRSLCARRGARS